MVVMWEVAAEATAEAVGALVAALGRRGRP